MSRIEDQPCLASTFRNPSVVINLGSGSTADVSEQMGQIFEEYGVTAPTIYLVEPIELEAVFQKIIDDDTDFLVVYGGDGTCRAGALIAKDKGIPFVPLPGGTMNILPKALYNTADWNVALAMALSQKDSRWQTAGKVRDHFFFCGAIIGDPVIMSEAREDLRDFHVIDAVRKVPDIMAAISDGDEFSIKVDGRMFDTAANVLHLSFNHSVFSAETVEAFEIASVPLLNLRDLLGIGAITLRDDWRASPDILVTKASDIEVSGRGTLDLLLDGEHEQLSCPFRIEIVERAVRVLAPNLDGEVEA